jgi:hypothetical protein
MSGLGLGCFEWYLSVTLSWYRSHLSSLYMGMSMICGHQCGEEGLRHGRLDLAQQRAMAFAEVDQ